MSWNNIMTMSTQPWKLAADYVVSLQKEAWIGVGVVVATGVVAKALRYVILVVRYRKGRAKKRHDRDIQLQKLKHKLQTEGKVSDARCEEILSWSFKVLVDNLQNNRVKATEALEAYQKQALKAHEKINCLVEPVWEAEELAAACDASQTKKSLLHGVPISVKDSYKIKGYDSTIGCSKYIDQPSSEDDMYIKVLKDLGAVPFVKTNVPQTMLAIESCNPIYGQTLNPYDATRTVGGSSGGEGGLIALGGSPLGVGGDIGGSIRIPCHFCGISGLRPTFERTSFYGHRSVVIGQNLMRPSHGPMGPDVESITVMMKSLLSVDTGLSSQDIFVPPIPFNDEVYAGTRKLRIGYYKQDGFFACVPACQRAVDVAVQALRSQGHELVEISIEEFSLETVKYFARIILADKSKSINLSLYGDKLDKVMRSAVFYANIPVWVKKFLSLLTKPFMPKPAAVIGSMYPCADAYEWYKLVDEVEALRQKVGRWWKSQGLDAVIAPGFTAPAYTQGTAGNASGALSYCTVYNVLNFPAGSVPVCKVTAEDDTKMSQYPVTDPWHYFVKKSSMSCAGLPLNVQVIALPWQEEMCLRVMKEIETTLKRE